MPDPEKVAASLTKGERRFLQRRYCGWCEARIDRDTCHAMIGVKCTPAEMQKRRNAALATYRPRKAHLLKGNPDNGDLA